MGEENGLKRPRTGEPRLNHEHRVTTANDSSEPNDFPAARLCRTHQAAGDHAHRDDRLVRIFFASRKAGVPWLSFGLLNGLLGIGLVSGGTAALNEVMERDVDAQMRRTALRPLPTGRMSLLHASLAGVFLTVGGAVCLGAFTNPLTGWLTFLTSVVYLGGYTPLKRVSPICTFVGAFPGAMPGVLGWIAVRGRLEWGTLVLFAILFLWQFPHFFSIAWLTRRAG